MALSDVKVAFGAKVGLVWIVSNEELRIERYISQLADQLKYHSVRMWTLTRGIQPVENPYGLAEDEATKDPLAALKQVYNKDDKKNERVIYIFKDLFPFLDDPTISRQLRDCNRIIPFSSSENIKQIIILDKKEPPVDSIDATIIKWALPNPEEIKTTINTIVEELPDVIAEKNITEEAKDRVVKAAIGLPINDIVVAVSRSLVSKKELDPVYVLEEKKRMVSRGVGLEWFDPDPRGLDGIGGMHKLKRWLINREKAFSPKAKEFGIPSPRGMILTGVPGCIHGDTKIYDPIEKTNTTIKERFETREPFFVYSMDANENIIKAIAIPMKGKKTSLFRIKTADGNEIIVTKKHRFWNGLKWLSVSEVCKQQSEDDAFPLLTNLDISQPTQKQDEPHLMNKVPNSQSDYQVCSYLNGEQLPLGQDNVQDVSPLPNGVQEHNSLSFYGDGQENEYKYNLYDDKLLYDHQPTLNYSYQNSHQMCIDVHEEAPLKNELQAQPLQENLVQYQQLDEELNPLDKEKELALSSFGSNKSFSFFYTPPVFQDFWTQQPEHILNERQFVSSSNHIPIISKSFALSLLSKESSFGACIPHDLIKFCEWFHASHDISSQDASKASPHNDPESTVEHQPPAIFVSYLSPKMLSKLVTKEDYTINATKYQTKIESIEYYGEDVFYDLHVPIYENYVANGFINHNSGKSLAAKCIGSAWGMPLLRLDVGSLFSKYVGSSEERTRKALSTIEAVAPAIVWLDEIEKGFGQGGGGDNGTSTRVLGTFLTWMQEKKGEIFVIATANNVAALPPELLRKGRWDELFFVDLPNLEERVEIFKVMKAKFSNVGKLNYKELAENSAGFTGAEIEAILISALYDAFNKDRKVNTKDILNNIIGAVGVKDTNQEQIEALRKWAKGRAINASDESEEVTVPSRQKESRTLEIGAN